MGAIVNRLTFPRNLPREHYDSLDGRPAIPIPVKVHNTIHRIYMTIFEPTRNRIDLLLDTLSSEPVFEFQESDVDAQSPDDATTLRTPEYNSRGASMNHHRGYSREDREHSVYSNPERSTNTDVTLIFSHGNAETIYGMMDILQHIADSLSVRIIAYDYEGYGKSEGRPSELALYRDILTVFKYVRRRFLFTSIFVVGRSIGTVPSIFLAKMLVTNPVFQKDSEFVQGLILMSPPSSALNVVTAKKVSSQVDWFKSDRRIGKVNVPILLIHGTADSIVPIRNSYMLMQNYLRSKCSPAAFKRLEGCFSNISAGTIGFESAGLGIHYMAYMHNLTFLSVAEGGHNDLFHLHEHVIFPCILKFIRSTGASLESFIHHRPLRILEECIICEDMSSTTSPATLQ